ncbi:glycosyltransferase [Microbacterium invictum]|uniref:Glycosyltransferase n=1 Tax=Microbacterium invictum TaxID=515415 RepID=A0ABZ0VCF1_9MICO|nr:glycosyltransferase [Microbacterium invictum]WQB69487.1 glycosyltransferase [Microbacterium invictum]
MDRLWWIRVIAGSRLVDADYYRAQRGWQVGGVARATLDYVWSGFREGVSPNPLFDEHHAGAGLPDEGRVPALYAYLVSDRRTVSVHPWWDAPEHGEDDSLGALEQVWASSTDPTIVAHIAGRSIPVSISEWRRLVLSAFSGATNAVGAPFRVRNLIVRSIRSGGIDEYAKVAAALDVASSECAVRLICLDPTPSTWSAAALAAALVPETEIVRTSSPAISARDLLISLADRVEQTVVLTDPRAVLGPRDYRELLDHGADELVAPVMLAVDGTIDSVGAVPVSDAGREGIARLLAGHPTEDLAGLGGRAMRVPLLTGSTLAVPAGLLRSFDESPWKVENLGQGLSVAAHRIGVPVTVLTSMTTRLDDAGTEWDESGDVGPSSDIPVDREAATAFFEAAGFTLEGWTWSSTGAARPRLRRVSDAQRWAIKTCAPAGPKGEVWGDTHFARGLANALRRLGHEVVVDAFDAANRPTTYLDDVHVVIRGPRPITPPQNGVRVEWIISHPDEITRDELARFDLRFAVSPGWAERVTAEWGVLVNPLLEATDADLFAPRGHARGDDIVFVGTARGIPRPSVVAPINAGLKVMVYGPDWRGFIPASAIAANTIPNRDLSERYETAKVVLNDHWPAMRREGFMAMRPFDVVAAGGRVISESVPLLRDVFEGAVVEYEDVDQLIELLQGDIDALFPAESELRAIAQRVRVHHSFDARAADLDAAVRHFTNSAR